MVGPGVCDPCPCPPRLGQDVVYPPSPEGDPRSSATWHRRVTRGWDLASRTWWQSTRGEAGGAGPRLSGSPSWCPAVRAMCSLPHLPSGSRGSLGGYGVPCPPSPGHLRGFCCPRVPCPATLENRPSSEMRSFTLAQLGHLEGPGPGKGIQHGLRAPSPGPVLGRPCRRFQPLQPLVWARVKGPEGKSGLGGLEARPGGSTSVSEERPAPCWEWEAGHLSLPWHVLLS